MLLCRDEPRKLLAVLTASDHPLAQHPDSAAALQELGTLFDYLEVRLFSDEVLPKLFR